MDIKKTIGIIISILIASMMAYLIHQNIIEKKKSDAIQSRIINNSVQTLIQRNDIEALTILAKEKNEYALAYLQKKAKDEAEMRARTEEKARMENAKLNFEIANSMLERKQDPKTVREAKLYLSLSSDAGYLDATNMLCRMNLLGIAQEQKFYEAKNECERLVKTPNKNQAVAYDLLAMIYFNGLGVDSDLEKAKQMLSSYLKLTHDHKNSGAILMLQAQAKGGHKKAPTFLKELNIPLPNLYEIIETPQIYLYQDWAEKEALNNNPKAFHYLAVIAGLEMRYDESVEYAKNAIQNGLDIEEQRKLLNMFRTYARLGNQKSMNFSKELSSKLTK
ncbi:hypothetical protein [Haemophilus parainfluenzae]|jgi:hypothetical protein|uniref:Sel1 repeat family protein n=2 Tax=Haemophilus parainfluenzae TaxID=729 RepID=A0AB36IPM6_HAEPA|nr:hypothetical protein [Haemophilus parainfluenzae]MDU1234948.1 hypothetical protein [Haemophilus parainfluenzae]OLV28438.1 hypothetical protein BSO15_00305 [Haemophilus parainfluenzae]OLV29213.1 hypothetical protein BSN92_00305 [Haemophilus parainfluenzae]